MFKSKKKKEIKNVMSEFKKGRENAKLRKNPPTIRTDMATIERKFAEPQTPKGIPPPRTPKSAQDRAVEDAIKMGEINRAMAKKTRAVKKWGGKTRRKRKRRRKSTKKKRRRKRTKKKRRKRTQKRRRR